MDNRLITVGIPAGITAISDWAFAENELASISLPLNLQTIGDGAFYDNALRETLINSALISVSLGSTPFVGFCPKSPAGKPFTHSYFEYFM